MRLVGNKAPQFNMQAVNGSGETFYQVKSEDYKGKWLILFFYPLDFTFVCPTEITAFSDRMSEINALKAEVLGVSTDSVHSHKAWINSDLGTISYPLASDMTHIVAKDFGVYLEEEGIALRGLYIIDPEGVVKYQVVHDNNVGRNVDEVLRTLQALQSGGLCPIGWKPGQKTLQTV
jgi:alkyl hydroperoxide reductase subunit AhpC